MLVSLLVSKPLYELETFHTQQKLTCQFLVGMFTSLNHQMQRQMQTSVDVGLKTDFTCSRCLLRRWMFLFPVCIQGDIEGSPALPLALQEIIYRNKVPHGALSRLE